VLVRTLPPTPPISYTESDAEYLEIERTAALLGWLRALRCPVLNRPVPLADYRQPALYRYAALFREAGLRLPHVEANLSGIRTASPPGEPRRIFVAGTEACDEQAGDLPPLLGRRCCRLAQGLGLPFLELTVWSEVVLAINEFPDMAGAGPALSRRLAGALARMMAARPAGMPV
jgi:hypothetical protein